MTELLNSYEEGKTLVGIIYLHRISDNRFGGITGRNFNVFRKLCGESTLKNVILVTHMWEEDPQDINEAREEELSSKFFKPALDKGAQMARHHNTTESARDILRKVVGNRPVVLQIQRELVDEWKDIIDTAVGESINRELKEQIRRHRASLVELQEEMDKALAAQDKNMRRDLEEAKGNLSEQVEKIEQAAEGMALDYATEKGKMKAKMREVEQEAKMEREWAKVELIDLSRRLQDGADTPAADRALLERELKRRIKRVNRNQHRISQTPPSVRIMCVPNTPALLLKCHPNRCRRVMGATGSGKTTVS